ncbi:MAG TPA: hypothetical protein VGD37_33580 [Kofleriaceae bacterium]
MSDPARSDATGARRANGNHAHRGRRELRALALGAIGVVYGDIGTSPLGVVSLFFWSLTLVVTENVPRILARCERRGLTVPSVDPTFFQLPPNRVVELGLQIEL